MHALFLAFVLAAPPATLDEKIAAALKSHPDIRAAEAKRLLAEAELEQARLSITQKVSAAASRVELAKVKVLQAEEEVVIADKLQRTALASQEEVNRKKAGLIAAKAELAVAELELQLLIGPAVKPEAKPVADPDVPTAKLPTGPAMEKLEAAVRMTVKLDFKDMERKKALEGLFTAVRIDPTTVRGMKLLSPVFAETVKIDLVGEQTFAGWVQLFLDEFNANNGLANQKGGGGFGGGAGPAPPRGAKLGVYVREYGLLIEQVDNAPKDAITLSEFSREVRAKQK